MSLIMIENLEKERDILQAEVARLTLENQALRREPGEQIRKAFGWDRTQATAYLLGELRRLYDAETKDANDDFIFTSACKNLEILVEVLVQDLETKQV